MPFVYVYNTEESSVPTEKIFCNTLSEAITLDLELSEKGVHSIVVE